MKDGQKVGVIGASGWLGTRLCEVLSSKGYEPVAFSRSPRSDGKKEWRQWSGEGEVNLRGLDFLINLAGEPIDQRWTKGRKRTFRKSRVDLTENLAAYILSSEVKVFLNASATGFYGDRGEQELSETAAVGDGYLARLCEDWERATYVVEKEGLRVCHLRTGVVLGRGGRAWQKVDKVFKLGLGGQLGSGNQWMPWIHLEDEIKAIIHCLEGGLSGPVNLVAPQSVTNRDFTRAIGRELGRPTIFPAPAFFLKLALGEFAEEGLLASTHAIPEKLLQSGFQFTHSQIETAVQDCARTEAC